MKETQMTDIEKLIRERGRIIVLMGSTFAIWQGGQIATQLLPKTHGAYGIAAILGGLGAVGYALAALGLWVYYRRVKKARAGCTLQDDWAKHIRGLSIQYGFFYVLGTISLLLAYVQFWTLPSDVILRALLLVAVVSAIFSYVWLERKGEGNE